MNLQDLLLDQKAAAQPLWDLLRTARCRRHPRPHRPAGTAARTGVNISWWSVTGLSAEGLQVEDDLRKSPKMADGYCFPPGMFLLRPVKVDLCPADARALGSRIPVLDSCCSSDTAVPTSASA